MQIPFWSTKNQRRAKSHILIIGQKHRNNETKVRQKKKKKDKSDDGTQFTRGFRMRSDKVRTLQMDGRANESQQSSCVALLEMPKD
jgi:hypothetical protein